MSNQQSFKPCLSHAKLVLEILLPNEVQVEWKYVLLMVGADQFHVKVKFNSDIMTFFVCPDCETVMSLRVKIAQRIQQLEQEMGQLLYNGMAPSGYKTLTGCGIRCGNYLEVRLQ